MYLHYPLQMQIINNLIGALKTSGPATAPSYNAQGRKPSGHQHHGAQHQHNAYLPNLSRFAKNYNLGL